MELFKDFLSWDLSGEVISSLIIVFILMVIYIIVGILARHHDPLKKSRGLLLLGEILVNFFENLAESIMGKRFRSFGGVLLAVASYLFIAFIWGLTGLPAPITNLAVALSLGFTTFFFIHGTSICFTKWKYFKRYVEPIPVFLPINLLSMWSIVLSLSLRLFGNALAGFVLMNLLYTFLEWCSDQFFSFLPEIISGSLIAPFITPLLHAYFDLFSGFIQTTIFVFLTAINVAQEAPEETIQEQSLERGGI